MAEARSFPMIREGSLSQYADGILLDAQAQQEIDHVDHTGEAVDMIIGGMVRQVGADGLGDIVMAVNKGQEGIDSIVSRSNGLRRTVTMLMELGELSPGTLAAFSRLQETHFSEGGFKLTGIHEIAGYLNYSSGDEPNRTEPSYASGWQGVILDEIEHFVQSDVPEVASPFEAQHMMSEGSAELGRATQLRFETALAVAKKAGLDIELLRRSAIEAKRRAKDGRAAGKVTLKPLVSNYDLLFG